MSSLKLWLVGCGKMGSALLEGWKRSTIAARIEVIDPHHTAKNDELVFWHHSVDALTDKPDVVILAVKPQSLTEVLPNIHKKLAGYSPIFLSIAAGKTLAFYTEHLGEHAHVVRAMPNTPALIGQGITALVAHDTLPASSKKIASDLMLAAGKVQWLESESLMDAVTAISGCGPAYVFLFIESLVEAGTRLGLTPSLSRTLAIETISGSLHLAQSSAKSLEELRVQVASPGGATEAALRVLMNEDALKHLMFKAAEAAEKRSKELS